MGLRRDADSDSLLSSSAGHHEMELRAARGHARDDSTGTAPKGPSGAARHPVKEYRFGDQTNVGLNLTSTVY